MTTDSVSIKDNYLPSSLLAAPGGGGVDGEGGEGDDKPGEEEARAAPSSFSSAAEESGDGSKKPVILVTNGDGIGSPGLAALVEALVRGGQCDVHVCAPESDKSASGHAVTVRETVAVTSAEFNGATAFEVSGVLFSWSRPALVISGINKGSNCGHHIFYSGAVAGAREALLCGLPSLAISLNWRKDVSQESDFKDAAEVCLPLIYAAIRDIDKGLFPESCLLSIEIPTAPSRNKGFKLTRQSLWRSSPGWQAVSANRHPSSGQFMSMHQSLGVQLAQLGRDASAAGAARRITAQRKIVEIESVGAAGKPETQREAVKKYFRLEFLEKEQEELDEELDFRALENGFIAVTPLHLDLHEGSEIQASASEWFASVLTEGGEVP